MKPAQRVLLAGLLALLLSACALPTRVDGGGRGAAEDSPQVHTDLIRDMIAQHQYYAALAHIQDMQRNNGNTRELRFLEAETRRNLGQSVESARLYQSLLDTAYAAQAYHGLGLLNARRSIELSIQQLGKAVQLQPTNVQFRNDLGYALMVAHHYPQALTQLATATELDQHNQLARHNLIVLLLLTHDTANAEKMAQDSNVGAREFSEARRQAREIAQNGLRAGG
jgi:Flp pilus assembly protein TadD